MTANTFDYVISGGAAGKSRLNILASVMEPYTRALLTRLGVAEGSVFLDNGCGGGNVAVMVARMTGPTGRVDAIDFDEEIIRLAELDRQQEQLNHLSFHVKSSYDLEERDTYDFSYARFLLSHLKQPLDALMRMKAAVKPGGTVIAEDVHFSGHFCYPENDAFEKYLEYYSEVVRVKGGNAELGPMLPGLFHQAGLQDIGFDVIQPCFSKGDGKWMSYITMMRIKDAVLTAQLAEEGEVDGVMHQLEAFTAREDTIVSLPRIFRVWGTRAG